MGGGVCGLGYRCCWTVGTDERTAEAGGVAKESSVHSHAI